MTTKTLQNWGPTLLALMFLVGFAPAAWAQETGRITGRVSNSFVMMAVREPLVRVLYSEHTARWGRLRSPRTRSLGVGIGSGAVGEYADSPLGGDGRGHSHSSDPSWVVSDPFELRGPASGPCIRAGIRLRPACPFHASRDLCASLPGGHV